MIVPERRQSADYPATHSMDATWFVVDRDGHVALFEAGNTVPIPETEKPGDLRSLTWAPRGHQIWYVENLPRV
jgi:hypothetical protein